MRESRRVAAGAPVTLRRDVGYDLVYYLEENQRRFPRCVRAARLRPRATRREPCAAHVLGSVGEISEEELKEARYADLEPGDEIGKDGVEYTYDRYLRGVPGLTKIQVDALGQPTPGGQLVSQPPVPGDNLKLTIDSDVQAAGEGALASFGLPGAFVTMNVHDGEILGMGSSPTFDPAVLTRPDDPGPGRRALPRPGAGAPRQPRHRRLLPDRLDVQADHRAGGARRRRHHA